MTAETTTRHEVKLSSTIQLDVGSIASSQAVMGIGDKRSYTLSYFDIRGRAETSRMLFALAEVEYTDNRVSYADWPLLKPTTPFGQLPVLEISGGGLKSPVVLHQSHTIDRYLASEFGLGGRTLMETAKIDMVIETMRDAIQPIAQIFNAEESKQKQVLIEYREHMLPHFLDYLTVQLDEEWFVDEVSLADVSIYVAFDNIRMFVPDFLDGKSYWKLREWQSRFESLPAISEWLANRPVTAY